MVHRALSGGAPYVHLRTLSVPSCSARTHTAREQVESVVPRDGLFACRRRTLAAIPLTLASFLGFPTPQSSQVIAAAQWPFTDTATQTQQLLPLNVYEDSLKSARKELVTLQDALELNARVGAAPPFGELSQRLRKGELSRIEGTMHAADMYIGERPMEEWEEQAWDTMGYMEAPTGYRKVVTPFGRTNAFLCLVLACFNDPRAPASTDTLLSLKMLTEGIRLGRQGDVRVRAEGLLSNVEDILQKLDYFLGLIESRRKYFE